MYQAFHTLLNNQDTYGYSGNVDVSRLSTLSLSSLPFPPSPPTNPPSSSSPWQYYFKGALAGMTGILISHPIDTVKTHVQTGHPLRDFKPSLRNLYRGLFAPLVGVGVEKAIVFGTYTWVLGQCGSIPLAGGIAGLSAAVIVAPYERIKILRQNKTVVRMSDITPRFLFQGLSATWTREIPGFAIYFSVYERLKHHYATQHGQQIGLPSSFLFGGLSGVAAWIFIYPQDRIKTIMQSSWQSGRNQGNAGFKSVMLDIYRSGGLRHFYSGFGWAVARAMTLHSGTFCMMEVLNRYF